MIIRFLIALIVLSAYSLSKKYEEGPFSSPSKKYNIAARVAQSNYNYPKVEIVLMDANGKRIDSLKSAGNDFHKWALGWAKDKDTVILYSSDVGTQAWEITPKGSLKEIELYRQEESVEIDQIQTRADELYFIKYKIKPPHIK